jgi:hypothetical protein
MDAQPTAETFCAEHPANKAVGTCARCGRFFCDECGTRPDGALAGNCDRCEEAIGTEQRQARLKKLYRGMAVADATRAAVILIIAAIAIPSRADETSFLGMAIIIIPFIVLAVLLWLTQRRVLTWLAAAWDVLVFGGFAAWTLTRSTTASPVVLVFVMLPVGMVLRAWRIHRALTDS